MQKSGGNDMSVEKVREYLKQCGCVRDIREFDVSSATVELASKALNVLPARIAKTLSFNSPEGGLLIVTAGDMKIDNGKYKAQFGCKAKMMSAEEVLAKTGHAVGGVCPFALSDQSVRVYTDVSRKRFETVFPACGSSNSAIELTCPELFEYSHAIGWIDVCKSAVPVSM